MKLKKTTWDVMPKVVQIGVQLVPWFQASEVGFSNTGLGQSGSQDEELKSQRVLSLAMS